MERIGTCRFLGYRREKLASLGNIFLAIYRDAEVNSRHGGEKSVNKYVKICSGKVRR